MSGLYNMLMGKSPFYPYLVGLAGITKENAREFGRLRDAWISEDAKTIGILHRNYGEEGADANAAAEGLPHFREHLETNDSTYRCWLFDVMPGAEVLAEKMADLDDNTPCFERYEQAIESFGRGEENEQTEHMRKVGEQIFGDINQAFNDGQSRTVETDDGAVDIISGEDL
jgi:hypothetical protein